MGLKVGGCGIVGCVCEFFFFQAEADIRDLSTLLEFSRVLFRSGGWGRGGWGREGWGRVGEGRVGEGRGGEGRVGEGGGGDRKRVV